MIYVKSHVGEIFQLENRPKELNYNLRYLYQPNGIRGKPFIYSSKQLKNGIEFKLLIELTFEETITELKILLTNHKNVFPEWPSEIIQALHNHTIIALNEISKHETWPDEIIYPVFKEPINDDEIEW